MPAFEYKAMDRGGRRSRGRLDATNEVDLELRLKRMGLDLITFRVLSERRRALHRGNISRLDLISFCFDVEQIARAKIPLVEGLRDLRTSVENPRMLEVLSSVLEDIEGGKSLSQALAGFPLVFTPVFVALVRAGEQAGRLAEVFASLGATLKWQDETVARARQLMVYPFLLLAVVLAVGLFLLLFLVPQVVTLLKNLGLQLPVQTRVLLALSDLLRNDWYLIIPLPVIAASAGTWFVTATPRGGYLFDYWKLRMPLLGPVLTKIIIARFANFFALMYQSGITILDALKTSEGISGNRVVAEAFQRAGQQINAGESLSEALQNTGLFPPLVVRMVRVGETTGALDQALLNVTYFYNREVRDAVDKALALLGPVMTLLLGGLLAVMMFSILGPVYEVIGKIKF